MKIVCSLERGKQKNILFLPVHELVNKYMATRRCVSPSVHIGFCCQLLRVIRDI